MPSLDESRLWMAASSGDRSAFASLFDLHAPALYRFALRLLGPGPDAEDAVQTVLLSVLEHNHYDPDRGPLRTYLFGAIRNQARKLRRVPMEEPAEEMASTEPVPEQRIAIEQATQAVSGAIARLPWAQREVRLLAHYEELPLKEIAEVLELELAAVKSRLHRARDFLRAQLQAYAPNQEGARR